MTAKHSYTVKQQGFVYKLSLFMTCVSLGLIALYMLTTERISIGPILFISLMLVMPFGLGTVWAGRYCIRVKGRALMVQKSFRLKPFQVDMADISKAVYVVTETQAGVNTAMKVHTVSNGKFVVDTLMDNGGRLIEQIESSVAQEKIEVVHRSFVKK